MNKVRESIVDTEDIPWPEVTKIQPDGGLQIGFAKPVFYRQCKVCLQQQFGTVTDFDAFDGRRMQNSDEGEEKFFYNTP